MSTLKNNITANRIALLAKKKEVIFHTQDLANLWEIINKNTLRITLKRYVDSGLLYRIYKGFYSLVPIDELNPVLIGAKAIHQFCYLSTESILVKDGYISQITQNYTFISEKNLKFTIQNTSRLHSKSSIDYRSRQLKLDYLYNNEGIYEKEGIYYATPERAICDLLYFYPKKYFDRPVNWKKIKTMQQKIGYPLTPDRYDFAKPKRRSA